MHKRSKKRNKVTFTIAIHMRNKPKHLLLCLESIKRQTVLPDEFILIENIIEHKFFSRASLQAFFGNKVRCIYRTVNVNSRAASRNLSLKLATGTIFMSIDDDSYIGDISMLENVLTLHGRYKNIACFVGPVYPTGSSLYELFSSFLYYPEHINNEMKSLLVYPTTFFSLRKEKTKRSHLTFNLSSNAEDIDFFWRLTRSGEKLVFHTSLGVLTEFPDTIVSFLKKRYSYALNNAELFVTTKGEIDTVSWLLPDNKLKFLLYPSICLYHIIKNAWATVTEKKISVRFVLLSVINECIILAGFFSSRQGRELFQNKFQQVFWH